MLRPARRLPKHLRRKTSSLSRAIAQSSCVDPYRKDGRLESYLVRIRKRCNKITTTILFECRLWSIIISAGLIIGTIIVLLLSPVFHVQQVQIRRQDARIDPEEIQTMLRPLFVKKLPLVTTNDVRELLASKISDIRDISIAKHYPSTLVVTLRTYPVVAHVILPTSSGTGTLSERNNTYSYITSQGYIVTSALPLTKDPLPVLRIMDWSVAPAAGSQLLTPETIKIILNARNILRENYNLTAKEILVLLRAKEYHMNLDGKMLWLDLQSPLHLQLRRFQEFLKKTPLQKVTEYVDVRISDRVIYK